MNDWYIDRSKNFVNPSLEPVLHYINALTQVEKSIDLINGLISNRIFSEADGNPYAALTRFRDHGLINTDNSIGEPAREYVCGLLTLDELIIDLFIKRPCKKKNSPNMKPFVCLCKVFDIMFDLAPTQDDVFLSFEECFKFLYNCNTLDEISLESVDYILNNRDHDFEIVANNKSLMRRNDIINISIWFNALDNTPLFIGNEGERMILRPNYYYRDFFSYISMNGIFISETPTSRNIDLYNYYCDSSKGITEIMPVFFKDNIVLRDGSEVKILFEYLFGIKKTMEFDYSYYLTEECFGVYHPFIAIPRLVIRAINEKNKVIGKCFYDLCKITQAK